MEGILPKQGEEGSINLSKDFFGQLLLYEICERYYLIIKKSFAFWMKKVIFT